MQQESYGSLELAIVLSNLYELATKIWGGNNTGSEGQDYSEELAKLLRRFVLEHSEYATRVLSKEEVEIGADWFTSPPAATFLEAEGKLAHAIVDSLLCRRLPIWCVDTLRTRMWRFYPSSSEQIGEDRARFYLRSSTPPPLPPRLERQDGTLLSVHGAGEVILWPIGDPLKRIQEVTEFSRAKIGREADIPDSRIRRLAERRARRLTDSDASSLASLYNDTPSKVAFSRLRPEDLQREYHEWRLGTTLRFELPSGDFYVPSEWSQRTGYGTPAVAELAWRIYVSESNLIRAAPIIRRCDTCGAFFIPHPKAVSTQRWCSNNHHCRNKYYTIRNSAQRPKDITLDEYLRKQRLQLLTDTLSYSL